MSVTKELKEIVQVNAIINSSDCDDVTIENENVTNRDNTANNVNSSSRRPHSVHGIQTIDALSNIIVTELDEIDSNVSNERRRSITASSIDSNKVSIKSIVDGNDDSINSSDTDSDPENVIDNYNRTDIYATTIGLVPPNRIIDPNNISNSNILCAKDATERPNIGSIAMQNCNEVTFGDKTYISGNVIVKQFIQTDDQNTWKERGGGVDNPAYAGSANNFNQNQNGNSPPTVRFYCFFPSSILRSMITIS